MDAIFSQRIARIVDRRRQAQASAACEESQSDRDCRQARERVINELSRVSTLIASVVGELNDRLNEDSITLRFRIADHQPTAEAIYVIEIDDPVQDGPSLKLNVDYHGAIWSLVSSSQSQSLMARSTVFAIDKNWLTNMVLSLLELYYP